MKVGLSSYREVCGVAATTIAEELALSFEEKVARLDEVLQTFSDEEMRRLALLLERQLEFHKRPPLVEMELIVTYRCNLACDCCFMRKQNLCMDKEIALQAEEGFYKSKLPEALKAGDWARPKCVKCPFSDICSGGCPAVNLEATGSLCEPPKAYCAEVRAWAKAISKLPRIASPDAEGQNKPCPMEG
jgi:radical SAM protein with 4Fe4S-binding SPASM domain